MFKNNFVIKKNIVEIEVKEKKRKERCLIDLDVFNKMIKPLNKTLSLLSNKKYVYFTLNKKKIKLHRYIMNCPTDKVVDHINRNPLDNRKCNLRCVNNVLNLQNVTYQKNNKCKCRGVDYHIKRKKWRGLVQVNKKRYFVGWFDTFEECKDKTEKMRKEKIKEYLKQL